VGAETILRPKLAQAATLWNWTLWAPGHGIMFAVGEPIDTMDRTVISAQPVACNPAALPDRARYQTLSNRLRAAISGAAELPDGYTYSLNGNLISLAEMGEWISLECQCCPFLTFELTVSGIDTLYWLNLTGPEGTKAILEQAFPA
jgi:hypothetical protein